MSTQEFTVKIPQRNEKKNYYVMKFNSSLGVDVAKWNQVRMVRENNQKVKTQDEEQPKFGAGSEFGREQKEEARRKKFGMVSKKYDPDAQPWLMRVGSKKEGKHYKGELLQHCSIRGDRLNGVVIILYRASGRRRVKQYDLLCVHSCPRRQL